MIEKIQQQLEKLNKREKVMLAATIISLFGFVTYELVFKTTFGQIVERQKQLFQVRDSYKALEKVRPNLPQLTQKLKQLQNELEDLHDKEKSFRESLKARNQIRIFLSTLEMRAKDLPLELLEMETSTQIISKRRKYTVGETGSTMSEAAPEDAGADTTESAETTDDTADTVEEGEGGTRTVKVTYTKNTIDLTYRADFKTAVEYLTKIGELPYAISVLYVNMTYADIKGSKETLAQGSGPVQLDTTVRLEIYFR